MRGIPVSVLLTAGLLGCSALGWAAVVRHPPAIPMERM